MRRTLGTRLGILCALGLSAAAGQEQRSPARRALLVGIERYPPEEHWPVLEGPGADVAAMRDVLVTRFGFQRQDVEELHDGAATHRGIAAALDRLVDRSDPGDLLLFYFAGHGSRLPDDDPDAISDGWDRTLVPYDACLGPRRDNDIRDDEIGRWIVRANQKTDQVVLVFDCGSADPGDSVGESGHSRYLTPQDRSGAASWNRRREQDGDRGSVPEARSTEAGPTRSLDAPGTIVLPDPPSRASGWMPPRARCVELRACRPEETAFEMRVDAPAPSSDSGPAKSAVGLYRGLFTRCLIDELSSIDSAASWSDLLVRVSAKMASSATLQSPVIEGALAGYGLFRTVAPPRAPRFEADLSAAGELRVHGGLLQGLAPEALFAVCAAGATRDDMNLRKGEAEVVSAAASESLARWRRPPEAPAEPGTFTLFLLERGDGPLPLPVSLEGEPAAVAPLAPRLQRMRLVRRVDAADARFRIVASEERGNPSWRVLDSAGRTLSELVELSETGSARLVTAIATLGRAWRVEQVLPAQFASDLRAEVSLRMLGPARLDGSRPTLGSPERDGSGRWRIRPGKAWCVSVVNRSDVPLYANVVIVYPDGKIVVSCPHDPEDRMAPGGAPARCSLDEIEIPPGSEAFYAEEPVRLYCLLTPRRRDLSMLAQEGFTTAAGAGPVNSWSASSLVDELGSTIALEIVVR
jgi:uncharacterized caspase-like protein